MEMNGGGELEINGVGDMGINGDDQVEMNGDEIGPSRDLDIGSDSVSTETQQSQSQHFSNGNDQSRLSYDEQVALAKINLNEYIDLNFKDD